MSAIDGSRYVSRWHVVSCGRFQRSILYVFETMEDTVRTGPCLVQVRAQSIPRH